MNNNVTINSQFAMVFPGQGSQSVGMLNELAHAFPQIKLTFDEASEALDYDLWQLVTQGPDTVLNQTEFTQPALLVSSVAIWRIWLSQGGAMPALMAGHSLGEYTALVCAHALEFVPAVLLVRLRGQVMQAAVPVGTGAMAAIVGLENEKIIHLCQEASSNNLNVMPANFNAIGQIVIAGNTDAVMKTIELAKSAGAKIAKLLPMSVPSHCELMRPAAQQLSEALAQVNITKPLVPIVNNVDVKSYVEPEEIKQALIRQLYSPVRWVETIQFFEQKHIQSIVECGPGKVLAGLNKRITSNLVNFSINTPENLAQALSATSQDKANIQ